jgi:hypothetical protein
MSQRKFTMKPLVLVCVIVLSACSSGSDGATSSTSTPSPEVDAMSRIVAEWNSGESQRWRATFSTDAAQLVSGFDVEIDRFVDQYEFFATLESQLHLIGCEPADGERGEAIDCTFESTNVFSESLGFEPSAVSMHVEFVGDEIVYWSEHFVGANLTRSAWWEFAAWVSTINPEHGESIHPFPGTAEGAELAHTYLQDYLDR